MHAAYSALFHTMVSERSPETRQQGQRQDLYSDAINQPIWTDCCLDKCEQTLLLWKPINIVALIRFFVVFFCSKVYTALCETVPRKRDSWGLSDAQFEDRE